MGARRALVVFLAAVLMACGAPVDLKVRDGAPALLVGDSLTVTAADELVAELRADGFEPTVRAVAGSGLVTHREFWLSELERLIAELDPAVVHIEFSGNHPEPWPTDSSGAEIRPDSPAFAHAWSQTANEVMAIVTARGAEVWWVLNPPMEYPGPARTTELVDVITLGLARGWPGLRLVDWDAALADADGKFARVLDGQQVRADDGVHLAPAGEARVARASAAAVMASVGRVTGVTAVVSAMAVERENFGTSPGVVVASARSPADALVAAPLAAHLRVPLMLAEPTGGNSDAAGEIDRLGATDLLVVGGVFALPDAVVGELAGTARVTRISGLDRYETAANVSAAIAPAHVYIARGWRDSTDAWTDALASAAAAAARGGALLFANDAPLPVSTRDALEGVGSATIAGGALAVPFSVDQEVAGMGIQVDRAAGDDRFATAAALSGETSPYAGSPVTVVGDEWSWGVSAAALRRPLLVVPTSTLLRSTATSSAVLAAAPAAVTIVGGWDSVSTRVETEVAILMRPT